MEGEFTAIVTEYVDGGSLDKLLQSDTQITTTVALTIAKGVADGMQHLHSENLIHCDLAARNVLVSDFWIVCC